MPNGILGVAEVSKHIGFPVHRAYYIRDVPTGDGRGSHGHKALRQCFLCLRGSVTITIEKHGRKETVRLDRPSQAAVVSAGCWRDLSDFSHDSVIIVLASDEYDESDYIRDHAEFVRWDKGDEPVTAVPYLDLQRGSRALGAEMELAMRRVLRSGQLIGGPELAAFETRFADYCEADHMVGLGNGLDALVLALRAWGIGPGDEVIVPAHTFVASALAVDEVGADLVLVDVEPDTGLMDMGKLDKAITPDGIYKLVQSAIDTGEITYNGDPEAMREYIHVHDAAKLSVDILDKQYENRHIILTGNERMRISDLMRMIAEMLPHKPKVKFGAKTLAGHYAMTPYTYNPQLGHKLVSNDYIDLGQGILDFIDELSSAKSRKSGR